MIEFVNNFASKLQGRISDDDLKIVVTELESFVENYRIENKDRAFTFPEEAIPKEYSEYLVSMKLEGKSNGTIKAYNATLVPFFLSLRLPLQEITTSDVKTYLITYGSIPHGNCKIPCGNHTLEIMRQEINSFFSWCEDNDLIDKNPVRRIKPIKFSKVPIDVLTPVELSKVRFSCRDSRERAVVETLYSTGVRVSELVSIQIKDIEWKSRNKRGIIPIHIVGKGNKHRTVYLNADSSTAIESYLEERTDSCPYIFVTKKKPIKAMSVRSVELMLSKIGRRAGIEHLHPHELRHTRATNFARESGSLILTSKMLGHSNISTTQKYYIATDDSDLEYEISKYC